MFPVRHLQQVFPVAHISRGAVRVRCATTMASTKLSDRDIATDLLTYVNASHTAFHAVEQSCQRLLAAGWTQLSERQPWDGAALAPGGRYFFTRNASTVVAFAVGAKYEPGAGFYMVGAHTDR